MSKRKSKKKQNKSHKQRTYKDTVFRLLFSNNKEALLSIYNALNGTNHTDVNELTINTLEGAIYMGVKNDVSFILCGELNLYEHQSTVNPNMPLRNLLYVTDLIRDRLGKDKSNIYSKTILKIPSPQFVVFYNGVIDQEDHIVYKLSEAFENTQDEPQLELITHVYNINPNHNEELKAACKLLREYTEFIETIRKYQNQGVAIKESLKMAIDECILERVLEEFLLEYGERIMGWDVLYDYDHELHMKMEREEHYELGLKDGISQGITQGISQGEDNIIINALKSGSAPEDIARINGIDIDRILLLQSKL